jgi:hypothetical protein
LDFLRREAIRLRKIYLFPLVSILLCYCTCLLAGPLRASTQAFEEYELKSVFVYKFLQFVEFPVRNRPKPGSSILICVAGTSRQVRSFFTLKGKELAGSTMTVHQVKEADDTEGCHVLFITETVDPSQIRRWQELISRRGVLTIGDNEQFCRTGGIIRLFRKDNNIRFEVNLAAAKRESIKISSKLLKLAEITSTEQE